MDITFLGTDSWTPEPGNDASGFLVNGRYLIDTGYDLVNSLKRLSIRPQDIEQLFFTHMHHDHYMALPQLLFFYLQIGKPLEQLHIYGPARDLCRVVELSMAFLQAGPEREFYHGCSFPTLHELNPGDGIELDDVTIETCASNHVVDGLCWRFCEKASRRVLAITGDTFYAPHIPASLHDCDLLVHENTRTTSRSDYENPPANRHSSIYDSVRCAAEAHAKRLAVVHFAEASAPEVLRIASGLSDIEVFYPERFKQYAV